MNQPSMEDWKGLYAAALAYRDLAPWTWMDDLALFAVENPRDGSVGYCTVLGNSGQEFGLGMFLGPEGLAVYMGLASGATNPEQVDVALSIRSLSFTLADRSSLRGPDLTMPRALGLRLRGRNAWPVFRSTQPGYLPWSLDRNEALFLTDALRQAIAVSNDVREHAVDLTTDLPKGLVSTRFYSEGRWQTELRKAQLPAPTKVTPEPPDEVRLQRLRTKAGPPSGTWEMDVFRLLTPIETEPGRAPYLPMCLLVADKAEGVILGVQLLGPQPSPSELQEAVLVVLEKCSALPQTLIVGKKETRQLVDQVARGLRITVRTGRVPAVQRAKAGMEQYMAQTFGP